MDARETWARVWPALLAAAVVVLVAAPAAVASYGHAREVAHRHDPAMSDWLPLSVDGMLLAALVVMWVRRRRRVPVGWGPWAAFVFGIVVTIAANAAAVEEPSIEAYAVTLFPPVALAVALELVALVAGRTAPRVTVGDLVAERATASTPGATTTPAAAPGDELANTPGDELAVSVSDDHHQEPATTTATTHQVDGRQQTEPPAASTPSADMAARQQDWMTDLLLHQVAKKVAAERAQGRRYGRNLIARDFPISSHQAREALAEIDRRNLIKVGA